MTTGDQSALAHTERTDGFRLLVIAFATFILCSCRISGPVPIENSLTDGQPAKYRFGDAMPDQYQHDSAAGQVGNRPVVPIAASQAVAPVSYQGPALPHVHQSPSSQNTDRRMPSNLQRSVPRDEFLFDGGDREQTVKVARDWTVYGLDQEDTVIHFDTKQGETIVEPSNRQAIYAPRFAAVRKVHPVISTKSHQRMAGYEVPTRLQRHTDTAIANAVEQPLQPRRNVGTRVPTSFRDHTNSRTAENARNQSTTRRRLKPFEDFNVIHTGRHLNSEKARLAAGIAAAKAWMNSQSLQVVAEDLTPVAVSNDRSLGMTYRYQLAHGKAKVRLIKLASRQNALPGDIVEFTLRFDNLGDEIVGNVTIIDSLTTRLEYVDGSQECTLKADFLTAENDGQSLVLRWEVTEPLDVGEGGVIRFKCRVR